MQWRPATPWILSVGLLQAVVLVLVHLLQAAVLALVLARAVEVLLPSRPVRIYKLFTTVTPIT